jgi:HPt (histidine-containing phosphotransfer) domain-containing protein
MKVEQNSSPIDRQVFAELRDLMMDEGPEFLIELMQDFIEDSRTGVERLLQAVTAGDAQTVERTAHTMKSSSAHLGALEMSSLCQQLQVAGRQGDLSGTPDLAQRLAEEFVRVCAAIEKESIALQEG